MMRRRYGKQVGGWLLTSLLGVAVCCIATARQAASEDGPAQVRNAASAASGMTVYVDPVTGAVLSAPAPGTRPLTLSPQESNALSTSDQGLVEVPSSVPGGGVKLDLQGRFQSPLIGTVDADGKIRMQRLSEPPQSNHKP